MSTPSDATMQAHPPTEARCSAINSRGKPCAAGVAPGQKWCLMHDPDPQRQAAVAAARSAGGTARARPQQPAEPCDLSTSVSRRRTLEQAVDAMRRGEASKETTRTIIAAVSVAASMAQGDLQDRLDRLEASLAAGEEHSPRPWEEQNGYAERSN